MLWQHSIETVEVCEAYSSATRVVIREGPTRGMFGAMVSFLVCTCFSFKMKTDDVEWTIGEVAVSIDTCFLGDGISQGLCRAKSRLCKGRSPVCAGEEGGLEDSHNQLHSNKNSKHLSIQTSALMARKPRMM